jgi:DNA (cytosine-5)-methyltransferase 1
MTTLDRFGLVEWSRGEPTLRMLQVPELQRAMGFDGGYKLLRGTRRDKIKLLGNGVCPPVMQAIVSALTGKHAKVKPPLIRSTPGRLGITEDLMIA